MRLPGGARSAATCWWEISAMALSTRSTSRAGTKIGTLQSASGSPVVLAGLWALVFGNGGRGGDPNTLYFTAGVPNGTTSPRGILGSIAPPAAISVIFNSAAGGQSTAVAPGEIVTITGQTVGPSPLVSAVLPASGSVGATLSTTSVTFNNLPAPVIYVSGCADCGDCALWRGGFADAPALCSRPGRRRTARIHHSGEAASLPGVFTSNDGGQRHQPLRSIRTAP